MTDKYIPPGKTHLYSHLPENRKPTKRYQVPLYQITHLIVKENPSDEALLYFSPKIGREAVFSIFSENFS